MIAKKLIPFYEAIGYFIAYNFVIQGIIQTYSFFFLSFSHSFQISKKGFRYHPEIGFFISLTGLLALLPLFFYSTQKHIPTNPNPNVGLFVQFQNGIALACWIPLTIYMQRFVFIYVCLFETNFICFFFPFLFSTLLGWICVIMLYSMLGFNVACYGLCWLIGFDSRDALQRNAIVSPILVSIWVVLRVKIESKKKKNK